MTDVLDRLKQALQDQYAVAREIGSGGMAVVYLAQDQKLGREVALKVLRPELAAVLGKDLPSANAPYTRDQIADAVDTICPALELVDDRNADYGDISSLVLTLIADNAWNAGIVLGSPLSDWHALNLESIHGTVSINDKAEDEGHGRDVLGHPLEALRWLVNTIAEQGKNIDKGMVVMTGTMIATKFVKPGDALTFSVDGLGDVSITVR